MKSTHATALATILVPAMLFAAACGDDDDTSTNTATPDAGSTQEAGTQGDGAATDSGAADTGADTGVTTARLRVAHLSPDAPAVRVCVTRKDATFGATDTPATPSLSYKQVSTYASVPPGDYKARIVAGTATDCATALAATLADLPLPMLTANQYVTAAAIGKVANTGATGLRVAVLNDLPTQPPVGKVHVRFFHAAPTTNIPVFVGVATGDTLTTPIFRNVAYGNIDTALGATNGFAALDQAATAARLGASATANGETVWATSALVPGGIPDRAIRSLFATDIADAQEGQVDVLAVDDTATGVGGINNTATVIPQTPAN